MGPLRCLQVVLLLAAVVASKCSSSVLPDAAPLGAYLGCFNASHATTLPGVKQAGAATPYTASTLYLCPKACREGNFSISIISPQLQCWCALATPDASEQLADSACDSGGAGVTLFYQHDHAATHKCRVVQTPLSLDNITVDYNQHNVEFTPAAAGQPAQMRLQMQGSSGTRVQPKCPRQMHGQFEATAKVTSAAGAVTAFYVRDSDYYDPENKGDFEELDVEFLNAHPGTPNAVWLNSYHRGLSRGERLIKPEEYQRLLQLPSGANNTNTWLTYTFTWQPSHIMWAINGVPVLKRTAGELVKWADMKGRPYARTFVSPDKPMHVSFSIWSDQSRFHFGGELDYSQSPYQSYFKELRRIVCEEPIFTTSNETQPAAAYGPAWLYVEQASWPSTTPFTGPTSPSPKPATQNTPKAAAAESHAAVTSGLQASSPTPSAPAHGDHSALHKDDSTTLSKNTAPSSSSSASSPAPSAADAAASFVSSLRPSTPAASADASPQPPARASSHSPSPPPLPPSPPSSPKSSSPPPQATKPNQISSETEDKDTTAPLIAALLPSLAPDGDQASGSNPTNTSRSQTDSHAGGAKTAELASPSPRTPQVPAPSSLVAAVKKADSDSSNAATGVWTRNVVVQPRSSSPQPPAPHPQQQQQQHAPSVDSVEASPSPAAQQHAASVDDKEYDADGPAAEAASSPKPRPATATSPAPGTAPAPSPFAEEVDPPEKPVEPWQLYRVASEAPASAPAPAPASAPAPAPAPAPAAVPAPAVAPVLVPPPAGPGGYALGPQAEVQPTLPAASSSSSSSTATAPDGVLQGGPQQPLQAAGPPVAVPTQPLPASYSGIAAGPIYDTSNTASAQGVAGGMLVTHQEAPATQGSAYKGYGYHPATPGAQWSDQQQQQQQYPSAQQPQQEQPTVAAAKKEEKSSSSSNRGKDKKHRFSRRWLQQAVHDGLVQRPQAADMTGGADWAEAVAAAW